MESLRLHVIIGSQQLLVFEGSRQVRAWPCSTSKFGVGFRPGSYQTPVGGFVVREKHGDDAPLGTIFKARQPVGLWEPGMAADEDLVLTRILWLDGIEPRNANTFYRYIYIHGTNDEASVGRPASHGCVRLKNADVAELFAMTPIGASVWIRE